MKKEQNIEKNNTESSELELEQLFIAEDNFDVERDNYLHPDITVSNTINCFNAPFLPSCDVRDGTDNTRPLSELGNAQRLEDKLKYDVYYVSDARVWLHWNGCAWTWCLGGAKIRTHAANLHRQIYNEGNLYLAQSEFYVKWARFSQKERTIAASVSLLKDFEDMRLLSFVIDAKSFHAGIDNANVVINLKTGCSRPAERDDFITKTFNIEYLGTSAKAIRWQLFLEQIFNGDKELIDWIKRWCGYLLTGSTSEQLFIFCYGLGANGKSVFAETIKFILGDYARTIASETLTVSKRSAGGASPDLMDLIGARLVICSETEDNAALAESLIKGLVSGDSMTARKLYADSVQFIPQFKLMMLGNHKPTIKGNDYGIWRRIRLIPFLRTFTAQERDPKLLSKLKHEAPHIMAWMVEGCLDWQKRGLNDTPASVKLATSEYQEEEDIFGKWLLECCNLTFNNRELANELHNSYKKWCELNGFLYMNSNMFGRSMSERGFIKKKSNGKTAWQGIELNQENKPKQK